MEDKKAIVNDAFESMIQLLAFTGFTMDAEPSITSPRNGWCSATSSFPLAPYPVGGDKFLSAKFNYKNSEWEIALLQQEWQIPQPASRGEKSSGRPYHRGINKVSKMNLPALSFIYNPEPTYNLTKADKYVFNAIFLNNLNNASLSE